MVKYSISHIVPISELEVNRVKGFVDIHTHILPGVDDGVQDISESVALLTEAVGRGTGAIVLTPHYRGRYRGNETEKLMKAYSELCRVAKSQCPGLELYLGCEIGYSSDIAEKLADGTVPTINGTQYVMLEFRDQSFRSHILDGVLEILNFGYVPIIAHAERCEAFHTHPGLIDELIQLGALIQINVDSVLGKCGFRTKYFCHKMLKSHRVHFIATDAHDRRLRKPDMKACYQKVRKRYGQTYADLLFIRNGRVVLSGWDTIEY